MIIKRVILTLLLLGILPSAHAIWEANALVGVSGGYMREIGLYNVDLNYSRLPLFPNSYFEDDDRDHGYFGGVLAGVRAQNHRWLYGLELYVNWVDMDHHRYFNFPDIGNALVWTFDEKLKHGTNYGLFARLGFEIAPYFLPYIHAGGETSHDSLDTVISGAPNVFPRALVLHDDAWTYRFTGGVGAEFPVLCLCGLSFRVQYTFYLSGTRLQTNGAILDGAIDPVFSTDIKPKPQSIEGAFVWNIL